MPLGLTAAFVVVAMVAAGLALVWAGRRHSQAHRDDWREERSDMTAPVPPLPRAAPAIRHMPAAISFNVFRLRKDLAAVDGFNAKVAILLTRAVGTMWAFWVFNGIALVSLPSAISTGSLTVLINWVSSNWIQLILLPALMVGQNLQNVAGDHRATLLSEHMDTVLDRLDTRTQGGITDILDALRPPPP